MGTMLQYAEGETTVQVDLGTFKVPHKCGCVNTTAFDVCIDMYFVTENPGVIIGCLFHTAKPLARRGEGTPESGKACGTLT